MKLRPFELALVIIFGGLAIGALIALSMIKSTSDPGAVVGEVHIWGTLPAEGIHSVLDELAKNDESFGHVSYTYYPAAEFNDRLVTALADGVGPDLILVSQEKLVQSRKRIQPISPESFPLRDFQDRYVDGAEIFYLSDGLYGYPIAVDPLMLYWNRDILANTNFLDAPKTWENLVNVMFPKLIKRDFDRTITRSVVAMGEYHNVHNAFGLISALLLQQGTAGVIDRGLNGYQIQLNQSLAGNNNPLTATADFYTRFSRPSNTLYSWNRAFTDDRQQFLKENLVFYFGYGSEARELERLNPNLNFDIAEIPQGETATTRRTYARFYALSLLKASGNKGGAFGVITKLAMEPAIANEIALRNNMVPAYRSLISQGSNDRYGRVTYQAAPVARAWLNPDRQLTDTNLDTMVQDINENRLSASDAAANFESRLSQAY